MKNCVLSVVQNQSTHRCVFQELAPITMISPLLKEITYHRWTHQFGFTLQQQPTSCKNWSFPSTCTLKSEYLRIAGRQMVVRTLHSHRLRLNPETLDLPKEGVEIIFNAPNLQRSTRVSTDQNSVYICVRSHHECSSYQVRNFHLHHHRLVSSSGTGGCCTHRQRLWPWKDQAALGSTKLSDEKVDIAGH